MLEAESIAVVCSTEMRRTAVHRGARSCTGKFGAVVKVLWRDKAAENLAARAGGSLRNARYVISGKRAPSAAMVRAVIAELLD